MRVLEKIARVFLFLLLFIIVGVGCLKVGYQQGETNGWFSGGKYSDQIFYIVLSPGDSLISRQMLHDSCGAYLWDNWDDLKSRRPWYAK